jgi:hypothetical protein
MGVLIPLVGAGLPQAPSFNQLPGEKPGYADDQFTYPANERERKRNVAVDAKQTSHQEVPAFLYS